MVKKDIQQILLLNNKHIAIIGAGASGLLCAVILGGAGFKVTIFEKNKKAGRKILATGNGKCNISNINISQNNFYSTHKDFVDYALKQFNYDKFKQFFENLGLELTTNDLGKVYPLTLQASSVVDILEYEIKSLGVKLILDNYITSIDDLMEQYDSVIIATGSAAMPKLGSSDIGYNFASNFGHTIIEPFASLVQLISDNSDIEMLCGVKVEAQITLEIDKQYMQSATGDLLFTNYGISGNTILDISREASYSLSIGSKVVVFIDIFPSLSKDMLISKLTKRLKNSKRKDKYFWLEGFVNKKLIRYIIDNCGIKKDIIKAEQLNKKDIMSLVYFMKNIKINITDTKGFETAEVSAGGIDVSEIENKSMQSKLKKDLYFVGEVLDVDGQCGGYNLHWAWASAYVCANGMKDK